MMLVGVAMVASLPALSPPLLVTPPPQGVVAATGRANWQRDWRLCGLAMVVGRCQSSRPLRAPRRPPCRSLRSLGGLIHCAGTRTVAPQNCSRGRMPNEETPAHRRPCVAPPPACGLSTSLRFVSWCHAAGRSLLPRGGRWPLLSQIHRGRSGAPASLTERRPCARHRCAGFN